MSKIVNALGGRWRVARLPEWITYFRLQNLLFRHMRSCLPFCFVLLLAGSGVWAAGAEAGTVSFSREIRPLLAKRCGACHGADEKTRKADLRLDTREGLLHPDVVKAGDPEGSALLARILTDDPDDVMPPPDKGDRLPPEEIDLLRRWIVRGAVFEGHWAFAAPVKPEPPQPAAEDADWIKSPLDAFVLRGMQQAGMRPAAEAMPEEWLRRATVDLTGLPPALEEIDGFLAAAETDFAAAKKAAVERLLAAPAYGERMANDWLDVARYADTYGRHEDADCTTWPYRDWVIRAFNDNLPYDQFITWQTAGDLLPEPTRDQLIATCFNRLPQQSNEAGSNENEFRIDQVNDRVNTNATAFLGLTMECARCHDHKYDPVTMRDYYSLSAFFNNINELGLFAVYTGGVPPPSIILHDEDDEKRKAGLDSRMQEAEARLQETREAARERFTAWLQTRHPPRALPEKGLWQRMTGWFGTSTPPADAATAPEVRYRFESLIEKGLVNDGTLGTAGNVRLTTQLDAGHDGQGLILSGDNAVLIGGVDELSRHQPFSFGIWIKPRSKMDRAVLVHRSRSGIDAASRGFELILDDMRPSFALVHFAPGNEIRIRDAKPAPVGEWTHLACVYDGSSRAAGLELYVNGERVEAEVISDNLYRDIVYRKAWGDEDGKDGVQLDMAIGGRHNDASFRDGVIDEFVFHQRRLAAPEVRQMALLPDHSQPEDWFEWYLREVDQEWQTRFAALTALRAEENELSSQGVELMVMEEMKGPRRPTHILERGQFDQPAAEVTPDTPAFLPPFPEDAPRNRLGLARWLTAPENPLTARVAVNRFWQIFFGRGLVETPEDFGLQGRLPDHPELLDWLALGFVDGGWDVKSLCREIVLSATYGQSALPREAAWLESDPQNVHLARGPRRRMAAEQVRDLALAASGLLNPLIGGPSVKPYQPAGLWTEAGTQHTYVQQHGDKLYRRSLYTFWRRTLPPANMTVFDAPSREFCKARRESTTTPMQALVLMNDVQFLEAARCLAASLIAEKDADTRAAKAFKLLTSRQPAPEQTQRLADYLEAEKTRLQKQPEAAREFLAATGESPLPEGATEADLAATTLMVRLLLGFSETTTIP